MNILSLLQSGRILLSDGAMGTELQKRGMPTGVCPEELCISQPDLIRAIHRDYFLAGADIVETNSFGANRSRLALHGFEERTAEFCRNAAQRAREVCPPGKFVAGSIGPTGDILEPLGPRTLAETDAIFSEQAEALTAGGVDLIIVETMMAAEEAEIAVHAAKKSTALPVAATMTFEKGKAGLRTMWGVDVATAVQRLTDAGADILGANCGKGFDEMIEIVREMRPLTSLPILAQANAGIPEWEEGTSVYKETPEIIAPKAAALLSLGVNILGGCCGTGPDHIRTIRNLVTALKQSPWMFRHIGRVTIVEGKPDQRFIRTESDVLAAIAECGQHDTQRLLLYAQNVDDSFFDLKSGFAGMMLQKFSNYQIQMAMVMDEAGIITPRFREMMQESSRRPDIRFFDQRDNAIDWLKA